MFFGGDALFVPHIHCNSKRFQHLNVLRQLIGVRYRQPTAINNIFQPLILDQVLIDIQNLIFFNSVSL